MKQFKNNKRYKTRRGWKWLLLVALMMIGTQVIEAQVLKPFEQRTAAESPNRKIYNIKGDFEMIGNTNLTLQNYSNTGNNSEYMMYVDVDGDPQTVNSSSATLQLSTENGANPDCSNVIFAGLYWTGRAHTSSSPMEFDVSGGSSNNRSNGNTFNGYSLTISQTGSSTTVTTYTFTPQGGGDSVVFTFTSNGTTVNSVTVKVGSEPAQTITGYSSTSGGTGSSRRWLQVAFTTPIVVDTGSEEIEITALRKRRESNSQSSTYFYATVKTPAKTLNKRIVKLKHADASSYSTVTADLADVYAPSGNYGNMYSAYAEVTEYVQKHGLGEYFVADMALNEGSDSGWSGGTGFFGGWGMIVIYENSKMKWRDITIFDGHAYVAGSTTVSHILEVEGFNTAQTGDVEMKLGLIAGEGDVDISGDYFQILPYNYVNYANNQINNNWWVSLSHAGNSPTNFFNASIPSTAPRDPELINNTGLDIAMFNINNANNSIITNEQTKTKFRYGSTQDTYIISAIAMAVDAYVPDVEANNAGVQKINGQPIGADFNETVYPNDEIEFKLEIRNKGTEAVEDLVLEIPIPFSGLYVQNSASATYAPGITPMNPEFEYTGTLTRPGTLYWNIGDLPLTGDPDEVLATLSYKIKITNNCAILTNTNCTGFSLTGTSSGVGALTGTSFSGINFITGYNLEGECEGEPILGPYNLNIEVTDEFLDEHCGDADDYNIALEYCDIDKIPFDETQFEVGVREYFPEGSRYWSAIQYYVIEEDGTDKVVESDYEPDEEEGESPVYVRAAPGATEYTPDNPFPAIDDGQPRTYYAIPPGFSGSCFWRFTITVKKYCDNYWVGTTDTDWGKVGNWSVGLPGTTVNGENLPNNVVFATTDNNKGVAAKENLHINDDRVIIDLTNDTDKHLVVTPGHQLKITGEILSHPDATGSIIVQAHKDIATGTFIVDPTKVTNVDATVQFYNKAYTCNDCGDTQRQQWQYFGIPVKESSGMPFPTGVSGTVNIWDETVNGIKWVGPVTSLSAFAGYEINDNANVTPTAIYNFNGQLNVGDVTRTLTKSSYNYAGWNLIGNSYTAAIPIATAISYDGDWDETVYLFNTGSRHDWRKLSGNTVWGVASGRYQSVPLNTAGSGGLPSIIPSMHAFMIKATSAGTMTLDYSKLTKNALVDGVAWRSTLSQPAKLPYIVMDVISSESADRVWLFENRSTTRGFDAGWDGEKMAESGLLQLYVAGDDDLKLQVATVPQLQDTYLGLKPTDNENIIVSFLVSSDVEPRGLYLRDRLTGRTYPIKNNTEYTLPGVAGENSQRFKVVDIAQGDEHKVLMDDGAPIEVFVVDRRITVANKSDDSLIATVYDIAGRVVMKQQIERGTTTYIHTGGQLPDGVYMVKVRGRELSADKRVIVR